jgi:hypothetical protein
MLLSGLERVVVLIWRSLGSSRSVVFEQRRGSRKATAAISSNRSPLTRYPPL